MKKLKYTCKVCGEKYEDTWDHISGGKHGWLKIKDEAHSRYMQTISKNYYNDQTCFCGGHISQISAGGDGWNTSCDDCEFLYDED